MGLLRFGQVTAARGSECSDCSKALQKSGRPGVQLDTSAIRNLHYEACPSVDGLLLPLSADPARGSSYDHYASFMIQRGVPCIFRGVAMLGTEGRIKFITGIVQLVDKRSGQGVDTTDAAGVAEVGDNVGMQGWFVSDDRPFAGKGKLTRIEPGKACEGFFFPNTMVTMAREVRPDLVTAKAPKRALQALLAYSRSTDEMA